MKDVMAVIAVLIGIAVLVPLTVLIWISMFEELKNRKGDK